MTATRLATNVIASAGLTPLQRKMALILLVINGPDNALEFVRKVRQAALQGVKSSSGEGDMA